MNDGAAVLFGRRPVRSRRSTVGDVVLVADVCVDAPGPDLDHPFTYAVDARTAPGLVTGVQVRVPFAGADVAGWVLGVRTPEETERVTPLRHVRRVVSRPVLAPDVVAVARRVADHYAGTLSDVLRTAVPPRHARAEREAAVEPDISGRAAPAGELRPGDWQTVTGASAFLDRVRLGQAPAAAALLPAWADPWAALAFAVDHVRAGGRSALVLVPDTADVERVVTAVGTRHRVRALHHALGPAARWRAFLDILDGRVDVVVGTRAAAFAPLPRLGGVLVWDDGDDSFVEPRAPGWHTRVVAAERARESGAAVLFVGHSRSVDTQWLVRTGALKSLEATRASRRLSARVVTPRPADPVEARARLPHSTHVAIATGVARGPVLVSVARRGYAPALACDRCRTPARCLHCRGGRLAAGAHDEAPHCGWCGRDALGFVCPECGGRTLRASVVGGTRTAYELGRAFPDTMVVTSHGSQRIHDIPESPCIVVATAGAEPVAAGGYAAAVVLDVDAVLQRPGLSTVSDAVARWMHVVSLVRPATAAGVVVLVGDPASPAVQAVVAGSPERLAQRLCEDRLESGLPPATVAATITGDPQAVTEATAWLRGHRDDGDPPALWEVATPDAHVGVQIWGPVTVASTGEADRSRAVVVGGRDAVTAAARDVLSRRSARRTRTGVVTLRVDPVEV